MSPHSKVFTERHRLYLFAALVAIMGLVLAQLTPYLFGVRKLDNRTPIKVGVLHSMSGTMAVSEKAVAFATLFAIEQLNENGGVHGRRVEPILIDGQSDWDVFAREAERLITVDEVSAVFGCWTSACRKTVKPVFEEHDHVLFYPVQYEGLEQSPNIIYTGAAPNQQIIPATKWSLDQFGKRVYLVGSDYVFPRTANEIMKDQVSALQGEVVGEAYVPLGGREFKAIISDIIDQRPDVIFNTINGDSNLAFYEALRAAGVKPQNIPVMSFSLAESEVLAIGAELVQGDYATRNYFRTLNTDENVSFKDAFKARYGADIPTTAPMEAAYYGVHMWAKAVAEAESDRYREYRASLLGQSMKAPSGIVYIDPDTQHTWRTVLIGQVQADGDFAVVWNSRRPIRPVPYPGFKPVSQWESFLTSLFERWNGHWAAESSSGAPQ